MPAVNSAFSDEKVSVMQVRNAMLDDLARLASGAVGAASGVRAELEAALRERFARALDGMELVNREEFEAVRAMAAKAREEQERLTARVAALEAALEARTTPAKRKSAGQKEGQKAAGQEAGKSAGKTAAKAAKKAKK